MVENSRIDLSENDLILARKSADRFLRRMQVDDPPDTLREVLAVYHALIRNDVVPDNALEIACSVNSKGISSFGKSVDSIESLVVEVKNSPSELNNILSATAYSLREKSSSSVKVNIHGKSYSSVSEPCFPELFGVDRQLDDVVSMVYQLFCYDVESGVSPEKDRFFSSAILYGPPGTGKSSVCKYAVAKGRQLSDLTGIPFRTAVIGAADQSKWVGESAKYVRGCFENCGRPDGVGILVLDDIDMIISSRNDSSASSASIQVTAELMQQMSGIYSSDNGNLLVLSTTNSLSSIDPALLSRFACRIFVPGFQSYDDALDFAHELTGDYQAASYLASVALETGLSPRDINNIIRSARRKVAPPLDIEFFSLPSDVRYNIRSSVSDSLSVSVLRNEVAAYTASLRNQDYLGGQYH